MPRQFPGAEVPRLQLRRRRAGHLQGPRHPALQPALADRRHGDRGVRDGHHASATTTSTARSGTSTSASRRRSRKRAPRAASATNILGSGLQLPAARAPRLRRLHLRRGNRAARVARRQEGPAALQAAVPGELRPVRQADHDQQHRDLRRGAVDHPQRRPSGSSTSASRTTAAPRSSRCRATSTRPGNYEIQLGTPFAKLLEMAGGVRDGHKLKAVIPGGSSMPVLPADDHDGHRHGLRLDRQGRLDARLGRGHRDGRDPLHGASLLRLSYFYLRGIVRPVHAVPRRHRLAVPHGRPHRARPGPHGGPRPAERRSPTTSRAAPSARSATPRRCRCRASSSTSGTSSSTTSSTSTASSAARAHAAAERTRPGDAQAADDHGRTSKSTARRSRCPKAAW